MFGLSAREKMMKLVQDFCTNNIHVYKNALDSSFDWMLSVLDQDGNFSDEDNDQLKMKLQSAVNDYMDAVNNIVLDALRNDNPHTCASIEAAMADRSLIGLDVLDPSQSLPAGVMYFMIYTSLTNKNIKRADGRRLPRLWSA